MDLSDDELAVAYRRNRERARAVCKEWEITSVEANASLDDLPWVEHDPDHDR